MLIVNICIILIDKQTHPEDLALAAALQLFLVLLFAVPLGRTDIALEVREQGVLHSMSGKSRWLGRLKFTPWNEIKDCKWAPTLTAFQARSFLGILRIAEDMIAPQQKTAVTAALGRFVPVYDDDGVMLAKPEERSEAERPASPKRTYDRPPFQFDLQSLLILTVAVACAASCYGVRHRRLKPRWDAIARLESFKPRIRYVGDRLWSIDFSVCTNQPTDDDLAILEPLAELESLRLEGTTVTDAGLRHLKGLKELRSISLTNTRVTTKGVEDLQRALPDADISLTISIRPPSGPPSVPPAPAPKAANKGR